MKQHFPVVIEQDKDGTFIVECPMFKGCRSYGDSIEEAIENLKEAIDACLPEYNASEQPVFIGVRDIELAIA